MVKQRTGAAARRGTGLIPAACPHCGRSHRSWSALASCRWHKGLLWISGWADPSGPCWACVSLCPLSTSRGASVTVTLWPSREEAAAAKAEIDRTACGGRCMRLHQILAMHELYASPRPAAGRRYGADRGGGGP
jgi:hypothetical protein